MTKRFGDEGLAPGTGKPADDEDDDEPFFTDVYPPRFSADGGGGAGDGGGGDAGDDGGDDGGASPGPGGEAGDGGGMPTVPPAPVDGGYGYIDGNTGLAGTPYVAGEPAGYYTVNVDDLRIYLGTTSQSPDSLLQAQRGSCTPAYRGRVYFVVDNLQLADYGNRIPSFSAEVFARGQRDGGSEDTVNRLLTRYCKKAGLDDSEISLLSPDVDLEGYSGYTVGGTSSARAAIEPLMKAYDFDVTESGYQIVYRHRDRAPDAALVGDDLAAHAPDEAAPKALPITRAKEIGLPLSLWMSFIDPDRDYQKNTVGARRFLTDSREIATLELPMVLPADIAARITERLFHEIWMARVQAPDISLPAKYLPLDAGDLVTVSKHSADYRLRITTASYGADGRVKAEAVVDSAVSRIEVGAGDSGAVIQPNITLISPTTLHLMDIPALAPTHDSHGFCYAAGPADATKRWGGVIVYRTEDDSTYAPLFTTTQRAAIGYTQTTPASGSTHLWDNVNTIQVKITSGATLQSVSLLQAYNFDNLFLVGRELIVAREVELVDVDTYVLSKLLRGRFGTEWAVGSHLPGERIVRLSRATVGRHVDPIAKRKVIYGYKPVTVGRSLAVTTQQLFAGHSQSLMPYSPAHFRSTRDPDTGDLELNWYRRARINQGWENNTEVPLDEPTESYEVEVVLDGDILRTLTASADTVTYTAAMQSTDGIAPDDLVTFACYQLSSRVGRGFAASLEVTF